MRVPFLPFDILSRITAELVNHSSKAIDDPESPIYWALSGHQLAAYRVDRTSPLEAFNQSHLVSLLAVTPAFREAASHHLRTPLVIKDHEDINRALDPQSSFTGPLQHLSSLEIMLKCDLWNQVFELMRAHSDDLNSISLDVDREVQHLDPNMLFQTLRLLSNTSSFIYRAALTGVWINQSVLLDLLASWPKLQHLTLFQLYGTGAIETYKPNGQASLNHQCQLRSLHLRRLCKVSESDLRAILSNAFESLEELTVVFDPTPHHPQSQSSARGLKADVLARVVADYKQIRVLRIADLVARIDDGDDVTHDVVYDPDDGPLGYVVDELVRGLPDLKTLETSGRIFSMDLFENLRMAGAELESLSVLRYPCFPFEKFLKQMGSNPSLSKLSELKIGNELLIDDEERLQLEKLCTDRRIRLKWLSLSEEEIADGDEMHMIEWSEEDEDEEGAEDEYLEDGYQALEDGAQVGMES